MFGLRLSRAGSRVPVVLRMPQFRCIHSSSRLLFSTPVTTAPPKPEVTITTGVDGQKVIIPKNTTARLPPGVRRKKDERPPLEDREAELRARMDAARQYASKGPDVNNSPELKKNEKWALFEVKTKGDKTASASPAAAAAAAATGAKPLPTVKSTSMDKEEKAKSAAAAMGASFRATPGENIKLTKEEIEKEKERVAIAAAHKEWDDLMDRQISNAIAVRGNCHETGGARISVSMEKAREHFKKAADLGCAESQYRYGLLCFMGEGGSVDMNDSYTYMLTAATNGHPEALWRTGVMLYQPEYKEQFGIESDPIKARQFIVKSAELGTMDAYEQLSILYRDGIGGEKNIGEAEGWLLRFEEASRDKRVHPHKYQRRWFRKKGEKPVVAMLKEQMDGDSAQTVADALDKRSSDKMRHASRVRYSGSVRGAR